MKSVKVEIANRTNKSIDQGYIEGKFGIDNNLATYLCDSLVNFSALLDTVGGRNAASKQPGDTIYMFL